MDHLSMEVPAKLVNVMVKLKNVTIKVEDVIVLPKESLERNAKNVTL